MIHNNAHGIADVHIHSVWSDGADSVGSILDHVARFTRLDVIAITDHDCIEGSLQARRLAYKYPFDVVVGMEVSSRHGHILALYIHEPVPAGLDAGETVERIHAQGGIAIAAHPCEPLSFGLMGWRGARMRAGDVEKLGLDGLEALNASLPSPLNAMGATALGGRLGIPTTGGSDSHHLDTIGRAVTCFPGRTARDLRIGIETRLVYPFGERWALSHYAHHLYRRRLQQNWAISWARSRLRPAALPS